MFVKITRKIHGGKLLTTVINTEEVSIPVISEQDIAPVCLYDEDGNLVETKEPTEKWFKVVVVFKTNGYHVDYLIDEKELDKLLKELAK